MFIDDKETPRTKPPSPKRPWDVLVPEVLVTKSICEYSLSTFMVFLMREGLYGTHVQLNGKCRKIVFSSMRCSKFSGKHRVLCIIL